MKKENNALNESFANALRRLRRENNLSQQELADRLSIGRSAVANWESGRRLPDPLLITRVAKCLGVEISELLNIGDPKTFVKQVMLVDDEAIVLSGSMNTVSMAMPSASIRGFTRPSEALSFAEKNHVSLAFVDIELGRTSGLSLCEKLIEVSPLTNIVFLTAYPDYAFDAWDTLACGFLVKPLQEEDVTGILKKLRHPL